MNANLSQSADSVLNDEFEDRTFRPDSDNDRPSWSDDAILVVNTNKSRVDGHEPKGGGHHGQRNKKKRTHAKNKRFHFDDGVSSASLTFLAGQTGVLDSSRPLPAPPGSHRVPVMGIGALSGPTVEYPVSDSVLPLLHRIVKTIGIWYHPHIDRSKAMNLLMSAEMGCFILRKSSRESSLALTVRNARPHDCDHYLIFDRPSGQQIEGSFLTFQTIPKLIEYYCVHLRELPYLLKLPDLIANCSCDRLLESYNNMGADFWSKYYSANGAGGHHHFRRHQQTLAESNPPIVTSKGGGFVDSDSWTLASTITTSLRYPLAPSLPPPPQPNTSSAPDRVSGATSSDNLNSTFSSTFVSSPHNNNATVMLNSGGQMSVNSSKTRSVDSLSEASRQRSSLVLRVNPTHNTHMPSYDVMWEMSEGQPQPPRLPPPPLPSYDLKQISGFPHPDRFRQKFTFDEVPETPKKSTSIIYDDPIDLGCADTDDYIPPVPPPRRASRCRGGRPPLGGKPSVPPDLRTTHSDDSLNRRVEASMKEINKSIDAMEADLEPPSKAEIRNSCPTSVSRSARSSTISESCGDTGLLKADLTRRRRLSQYDNVSTGSNRSLHQASVVSVASSRGTVFSAPWDNSVWHQVIQPAGRDTDTIEVLQRIAKGREGEEKRISLPDDATPTVLRRNSGYEEQTPTPQAMQWTEEVTPTSGIVEEPDGHDLVKRAQARICESAQSSGSRNVGAAIDKWLEDLAVNPTLVFGEKMKSFIECTRDASERNPHSVMRNVRQFMDGIKHYLVQRDETGFHMMIENERRKLASGEFLNVERRLESALYKLILKPLKQHLDNLMVDWHHQHGNLQRVHDNIRLASKHTPERLGIRNGLQTPSEADLSRIKLQFKNMEESCSPLEKLECLLAIVEIIYSNSEFPPKVQDSDSESPQLLNTDDLMPVFTYVLVRCEVVSAELEAEYMQGLLASKFLLGEGAYYLATLQAAVTVIKNFHRRPSVGNMTASFEDLSQMHGVLRVIVLDERTDSTKVKTFPARPTMTARDLSILVAHRCHIFNPQDFSLYHCKDGIETILKDLDLPYKIKVDCEQRTSKQCHFLYRRTNAVFALPLSLTCSR